MNKQAEERAPETIRELLDVVIGKGYEMRTERNVHRNWVAMPDPKPTWEQVISAGWVRRMVDGFSMPYLRRPTLPSDVL